MSTNKSTAIVVRSGVPSRSGYNDYKEELRYDFIYSCAYCSVTEVEARGFRFEIDHYRPQSKHPNLKSRYSNLMWACERCNLYKDNYDPDKDDIDNEREIIKIDREDPDDYAYLDGERLKPKNLKGEFNIVQLMLNRKCLRRIRELRSRLYAANEAIAFGLRQMMKVRIDDVRGHKRKATIYDLRLSLQNQAKSLNIRLDELLRQQACSELLDPDPEHDTDLERRRQYLKRNNAILPGIAGVKLSPAKPNRKGRSKKRKG